MVTARPPYPADKGLFERPTIVNNVETLANLGWIVRHGGEAYAKIGVGKSRGTKAVSLNERFVRPGMYEVPLGMPLRELLVEHRRRHEDGRADQGGPGRRPARRHPPGARSSMRRSASKSSRRSARSSATAAIVAWDDSRRRPRHRHSPLRVLRRRVVREVLPLPDRRPARPRDSRSA